MANIGFHTGPGGNRNGLGDWMRQLDAANIPFFLKSTDDYGPLFEAAQIRASSGVDHSLVFRLTTRGQNDGNDYDVPNYSLPPAEAAVNHWQMTKAKLPPELDKENVWVEPINEVDKNRAAWLGTFAITLAELANAEGYRVTLFGWSSGEPEYADWQSPQMLAYLELCAERPDRVAVSLHEYSFDVNDILRDYPFLVGRFHSLFQACDAHDISRPTVHITEWGWEYQNVPSVDDAMSDIAEVDAIYGVWSTIKGAAIWYLGADFGGIADQAQKLIAPVTEYYLNKGEPEPPDPPDPPDDNCNARVPYSRVYWVAPNTATREQWHALVDRMFDSGQVRTLGPSYDDAGIGCGLSSKLAVLFDIPEEQKPIFINWYEEYYPGTDVAFETIEQPPIPPDPPDGEVMFGLHATADPAMAVGEIDLYQQAEVELIKVLSNINPADAAAAAAAVPNAKFIVRAFLHFGGRFIAPQQFYYDTVNDVERTINAVGADKIIGLELHNEPNLTTEGLGSTWSNGYEFRDWLFAVLELYRSEFPWLKMIYPGLSPGGSNTIRLDDKTFLEQSQMAVQACNAIGVHAYWAYNYAMSDALAVVQYVSNRFNTQPLWVTEASNNKTAFTSPEAKAAEYIQFWNMLKGVARVEGVTYFLASSIDPAFGWESGSGEVWLGTNIASIVGNR